MVTLVSGQAYTFPDSGSIRMNHRPVIIGMGPAGLFCAYMLAKHGYRPIVLERGYDVETRTKAVEEYWQNGILQPESNVQFGEGGAGTFSDGKLNTLVKDKYGRSKEVMKIFVQAGAPEEILYESKPHIGTDILKKVVTNMRQEIIRNGGEVHFRSKVTGIETQNKKITGVIVNNSERIRDRSGSTCDWTQCKRYFCISYERTDSYGSQVFCCGYACRTFTEAD